MDWWARGEVIGMLDEEELEAGRRPSGGHNFHCMDCRGLARWSRRFGSSRGQPWRPELDRFLRPSMNCFPFPVPSYDWLLRTGLSRKWNEKARLRCRV